MTDAYRPAEMAQRVADAGVAKASLPLPSLIALSTLAGAFISLGAAFSIVAVTGSTLPYGVTRIIGGLAFSLGLILVIVAGAELFTGNLLIVMAWASRQVSTRALLRNWVVSWFGNFAGAVGTAALIYLSCSWKQNGGGVGATAFLIACAKVQIPFGQAIALGALCNALVCLAVWLSFSANTTTDKILAIIFPITAFVALGFEHSIANMYFLPFAMMLKAEPSILTLVGTSPELLDGLTWQTMLGNLLPVTIGNMLGGGLMVAGVYWFIYLRKPGQPAPRTPRGRTRRGRARFIRHE